MIQDIIILQISAGVLQQLSQLIHQNPEDALNPVPEICSQA